MCIIIYYELVCEITHLKFYPNVGQRGMNQRPCHYIGSLYERGNHIITGLIYDMYNQYSSLEKYIVLYIISLIYYERV